jgi:DNA polymerase (family 10)
VEFVEIVADLAKEEMIREFQNIPDTVIEEEPNQRLLVQPPGHPRIRIHLSGTARFYHTLFMTTGSDEFLSAFLTKYKVADEPASEEDIFTSNGIAWIPPMLRETASILEKAAANSLNELITAKDIRGIIHSHSTWSDGLNTIEQMAKEAIKQGLEYLVISDHSQSAYYAKGLKPEQVAAQHQEIDALNAKLAPFKIFKSIESDILGDGSLDYNDSVLSTFDIVIASVHSNLKMSQEKAMERVLTAIRNPYTAILGHPTGRLLLSRKGYPLDHKLLIEECARHKVVIEINAHPRRLDLDWRWIEYAMECGVLLSVNPDAHSVDGFRDTYYGVMAAQKGGLTPQFNLSSYTRQQFEDFIVAYREKQKVFHNSL